MKMTSPLTLFFMAVFFLETLATMLQNGIMAVVLGWEWLWGQGLPAGDTIIMCLAISRFSLHGMTFMNNLLVFFNFNHKVHYFIIFWEFSNTLTFWLTALLSVFYCMRIASFSHPTFLWLRWRISRAVPRLLLGCVAVSALTTIPPFTSRIVVSCMEGSQPSHTNGSWADQSRIFYGHLQLLQVLLVLLLPFLLFLVSTALLMFSLCWHLHRMRGGQPGPRDPSTQAHTMALKSLGFFLVFYSSYFLFLLMALIDILPAELSWHWPWQAVTYAGVSLHSTILLFSNPRLRKALKTGPQGCGAGCCGRLRGGLRSGASAGFRNPTQDEV